MIRALAALCLLWPSLALGQALDLNNDDILILPLDQLPSGPNDPPQPPAQSLTDPFADEPRAQVPDPIELPVPAEEVPVIEGDILQAPAARLRGLDTMTNTVDDFEIRVGETLAFKRLIVRLDDCRYPRGEVNEEAYAFLTIRDRREETPRFSGWMLASSPALSALDHPRYDIWVLSCRIE